MQSYTTTKAALLALALAAGAVGSPAQAQGPIPIKVTVTVAGRTETLRGTGQCEHEPRAWLYGAAASLWRVEYTGKDAAPQLSLTYWRMAAGGEQQFALGVQRKKASHRISTIKAGKLEGSGRATFRPTARGGRFEVNGKAGDGASLQVTIECARFGGIVAEGG